MMVDIYQKLKGLRLLLIDDDEWVRDSMSIFFESEGCHILTLETAEEGLHVLTKQNFDIIIIDYRLPGLDGLEFLKTFEKVMCKAEEFKQIKEELEDTFMDLEFHRDELQNITKKYIKSQVALEERNYEIRKLQNELKRLQKRAESREEEVFNRLKEVVM